MCEHGKTVDVEVMVLADYGCDDVDTRKVKPIDSCIAPIVKALDAGGIYMLGSCCGHGKQEGEILLADGRILRVQRNPGQ